MKTSPLVSLPYLLVACVVILSGCVGGKTFNNYARSCDTVAVATGWNHAFQTDNIQVTVNDFVGAETVYTAASTYDPACFDASYPTPYPKPIRGSMNFYPDPLSSVVVSERLQTNVTPSAQTYANLINTEATDLGVNDTTVAGGGDGDGEWDRDWWQTVVFIDLPSGMAEGVADITITDIASGSETASSVVDIISGTGSPNQFDATLGIFGFSLSSTHFDALARADHYVVDFSGSTVPAAIEIDLLHDGTGTTPYVVNPTGTIKTLSWSPTDNPAPGEGLKVIMMPTRDGEIHNMADFKFYVTGGLTGVAVNGPVQAFDASGVTVPSVTATVTPVN